MKTKEIVLAVGGLFLAMNYNKLFGRTLSKGSSSNSSTGGGSSTTGGGSSRGRTRGKNSESQKSGSVKTGNLTNCPSFKWTSDMVNFANKNPQVKAMVKEFQRNANRVNQLKIMRGYTKNFRIQQDGDFGACTQEAALMAFPKNWFYENNINNVFTITDRIQVINAMLKGKSTTYIYNNLIMPNKL